MYTGPCQSYARTEGQVYCRLSSDRRQVSETHGRLEESHGPEEQSGSGRDRGAEEQTHSGNHRRPQQRVQQLERTLQRYNCQ